MRIIAGELKGRPIKAPRGHKTHPMAEKIRGALFNVLGDVAGLTVLGAFAGSGALSLEAISRGAAKSVAIDNDKYATRALKENIEDLGLAAKIKAISANASGWSDNNPDAKFDLILLDPPHDDVQPALLNKLSTHLKPNGLAVLSWPGREIAPELNGLNNIETKNYGDAQLVFYKKQG